MAAAALAAACSKHMPEPVGPDYPSGSGSYIFFEQEVMDVAQTRTTMVEGDKLPSADGTAFGVMGYVNGNVIFNNATYHLNGMAKVTRNGSGEDAPFTYQGLAQWADATSVHNFYAFYPYKFSNLVSVGSDQVPYIRYAQEEDTAKMDDILTARASLRKQPVVTMAFEHRLWALDITVKNQREHKDSLYNTQTGQYETLDPIIKIKNVTVEFAEIPSTGNLYLDGRTEIPAGEANKRTLTRTYAVNKTFNPTEGETINGQNSFLFLPCGSFKYRFIIEFENAFGMSYTSRYPDRIRTDGNGDPLYIDGVLQWDWATAQGPDRNSDGAGDGFLQGYRYTLDLVKDDYEVRFIWKETQWGEWNEETQQWDNMEVVHSFI